MRRVMSLSSLVQSGQKPLSTWGVFLFLNQLSTHPDRIYTYIAGVLVDCTKGHEKGT